MAPIYLQISATCEPKSELGGKYRIAKGWQMTGKSSFTMCQLIDRWEMGDKIFGGWWRSYFIWRAQTTSQFGH